MQEYNPLEPLIFLKTEKDNTFFRAIMRDEKIVNQCQCLIKKRNNEWQGKDLLWAPKLIEVRLVIICIVIMR